MPIYSMKPVLDTTALHPARIAAANGGCNPYNVEVQPMSCWDNSLRRSLYAAWEHDARGWDSANHSLAEANELTRIQLATR